MNTKSSIRIGLIHSSNKDFSDSQNYGLKFSPVWAFVLSSYIKRLGHEAVLFDLNVNNLESIKTSDIFFFSGINQDLSAITRAVSYVKERYPRARTFIGGPIAWSFDQAAELAKLSAFDHICIGDGEILVSEIIRSIEANLKLPHVLRAEQRFDLRNSLPMDEVFIEESYKNYYGAVIEVSRGCPFLCEFCDIRVLPDNNKSHNRPIDTILFELDVYRRLGIRNIQFACDNFIGDYHWANQLVDRIIEYNKDHDYSPSFYTWLTINVSNYDQFLEKMRIAGFDNLFIGIESFDNNTLLETAKVQNTKFDLINAIKKIHSFGFIVVAGLIFGFDSDDDQSFDSTLDGITQTGLLSGDASLLTALPGTPLFRRMKLSGRLRRFQFDAFLGGYKYVTNIKYLMAKETLIEGYINFSKSFLDGKYQFSRISNFYSIITNSEKLININRPGYTNIGAFLIKAFRSPKLLMFHLVRLAPLLKPSRAYYLVKAISLAVRMKFKHNIGLQYFVFWLFIWVNALNKYRKINVNDFNIAEVDKDFRIQNLIPDGYREAATEQIPANKIDAQYRATVKQLENVIRARKGAA